MPGVAAGKERISKINLKSHLSRFYERLPEGETFWEKRGIISFHQRKFEEAGRVRFQRRFEESL